MKVVLLKSVDNLGQAGEQVSVKNGYFRNFLEPRGMALTATDRNIRAVDSRRRKLQAMVAAEATSAEVIKKQLEGIRLEFSLRAGEKGQLYGSVTAHDITARIKEQFNIEIERRKVDTPHLKTLGNHAVRIRIYPGVVATINVHIDKLAVEVVDTLDHQEIKLGLEAVLEEQEQVRRASRAAEVEAAGETVEAGEEAPAEEPAE
jgi:large subunit ribosomal protein L9